MGGRLEVLYNGEWGTVCDDSFDRNDAKVVCRQLGLPYRHATPFPSVKYGEGSGRIWLDEMRCQGDEDSIFSCDHDGLGSHDCKHSEDVGVRCSFFNLPSIASRSTKTGSPKGNVKKFANINSFIFTNIFTFLHFLPIRPWISKCIG